MLHSLLHAFLPKRKVAYDESFFRKEWFDGWAVLSGVLGQLITSQSHWRSILDFGCGPGAMIDPINDLGIHYIGCDYSAEARDLYLANYGKYPERYLTRLDDLEMHGVDVFLSFDVFEHMTDDQINQILDLTGEIPQYFLNISRDWRTPGHVNIKSDRDWIAFFRRHGLGLCEDATGQVRGDYRRLRPGCPDRWDRNMFILAREK